MAVLIVTGSPGAGKTTTARVVAERFERAVHVESDVFYYWIRAGFIPPWQPDARAQNASVIGSWRRSPRAMRTRATSPWSTASSSLAGSSRRSATHSMRPVTTSPMPCCALRSTSARRGPRTAAEHPFADADALEPMWSQFSDLGAFEPHAIETAGTSPGEVADLMLGRLRDGSLGL